MIAAGTGIPVPVLKRLDMTTQRLDTYDRLPSGMREYISTYGWHFSKKMCEWAVGMMKTKDETTGKERKLEGWSCDEVEDILKKSGVSIENDRGYDVCYVANMLKADFYKKSIPDEQRLAMHIKLYLDDIDGDPCRAFDEFYATCIGKGMPVMWDKML